MTEQITVDCFAVQLDDGENLRALRVGDYLELREPAAGMSPGSWQLLAFEGEFNENAVMRKATAADAAAWELGR